MILQDFKTKLGGYLEKYEKSAIYHSELYCFYHAACELGIRRIIDCEAHKGFTARRLQLLFPTCKIVAYNQKSWQVAYSQKKFPGIMFITGSIDMKQVDKDTAVLIDVQSKPELVRILAEVRGNAGLIGVYRARPYLGYLFKEFDLLEHSGSPTESVKELDAHIPIKEQYTDGFYGQVLAMVR